jgi:hypothetical protein
MPKPMKPDPLSESHLGRLFVTADDRFHGLILDRLVESPDE